MADNHVNNPLTASPVASMDQTQIQTEDMEALVERENQLKKLESDVSDMNQIFKELDTMVHEEEAMIEDIVNNMIEPAEVHVEQANAQLVKARQYQTRARRKKCLIVFCLIITSVIVALILYFSLKKK